MSAIDATPVIAAPSPLADPAGADAHSVAALRAAGAEGPVIEELLHYARNQFAGVAEDACAGLPLPDEPFVAAWQGYVAEAGERGVWDTLRDKLIQLRFPIVEGISQTMAYQAAVRRGERPVGNAGIQLRAPEDLRLWLHPTQAGRIPVLHAGDREDFVTLVRALTHRNEPGPVPASMGACIVGGYNNWDRVRALRAHWQSTHPAGTEAQWQLRFREIIPQKHLYQDRFILLSSGWYSAVPPAALDLEAEEWARLSVIVRLEHECAHYFTRRLFGSMRNSLHDELIADFAGIRAAVGEFRSDWFLRFMGLENYPAYRAGGRLENYRGSPPLSAAAFRVLQTMVVNAAAQLERFDRGWRSGLHDAPAPGADLATLARMSLIELAIDAEPAPR